MRTRPLSRWRRRGAHLLVAAVAAFALAASAGVQPSPATAATAPVGALTTSGNKLLTAAGKQHTIKAVSWFGMETSNCAPHGLWTISLEQGLKTIADQGFNTVRLPFANQCIGGAPVQGVDFTKNPQLAQKSSLQVMDYFIERAGSYGLSVLLDRHRPDYNSQSELWYTQQYSEQRWVDDWVMLAKRYKGNSTVIGADLHNEPRGNACWGCGDTARDWRTAATKAGNAVLAANPAWLIVVEGVERSADGANYWWGGNLKDYGVKLLGLNVANRVVYSPHDYPASVYGQQWFNASNYPANLPSVWDAHWGYLSKQKNVPVLLGEFGTKYQTTSDRQWLGKLVEYLGANSMSFSFWSFNPNSGDTGGIVKDDWTSLETEKLAALRPLLAATGNTTPSTPAPSPTATPTPKPTSSGTPTATPKPTGPPTATPKPSTTPTPQPSSGSVTAEYLLQSKWGEGYVADLIVRAPMGAPRAWTVSWPDAQATGIANAWGMKCSVASARVTCTADAYGKDNFISAGEVRVGVQVLSRNGNSAPTAPKLTVK